MAAKKKERKIEAPEAARKSAEYYREVSGEKDAKLRVTEAIYDERRNYWFITLAVVVENDPLFLYSTRTEYRMFEVNAETGDVLSMKVKKIE